MNAVPMNPILNEDIDPNAVEGSFGPFDHIKMASSISAMNNSVSSISNAISKASQIVNKLSKLHNSISGGQDVVSSLTSASSQGSTAYNKMKDSYEKACRLCGVETGLVDELVGNKEASLIAAGIAQGVNKIVKDMKNEEIARICDFLSNNFDEDMIITDENFGFYSVEYNSYEGYTSKQLAKIVSDYMDVNQIKMDKNGRIVLSDGTKMELSDLYMRIASELPNERGNEGELNSQNKNNYRDRFLEFVASTNETQKMVTDYLKELQGVDELSLFEGLLQLNANAINSIVATGAAVVKKGEGIIDFDLYTMASKVDPNDSYWTEIVEKYKSLFPNENDYENMVLDWALAKKLGNGIYAADYGGVYAEGILALSGWISGGEDGANREIISQYKDSNSDFRKALEKYNVEDGTVAEKLSAYQKYILDEGNKDSTQELFKGVYDNSFFYTIDTLTSAGRGFGESQYMNIGQNNLKLAKTVASIASPVFAAVNMVLSGVYAKGEAGNKMEAILPTGENIHETMNYGKIALLGSTIRNIAEAKSAMMTGNLLSNAESIINHLDLLTQIRGFNIPQVFNSVKAAATSATTILYTASAASPDVEKYFEEKWIKGNDDIGILLNGIGTGAVAYGGILLGAGIYGGKVGKFNQYSLANDIKNHIQQVTGGATPTAVFEKEGTLYVGYRDYNGNIEGYFVDSKYNPGRFDIKNNFGLLGSGAVPAHSDLTSKALSVVSAGSLAYGNEIVIPNLIDSNSTNLISGIDNSVKDVGLNTFLGRSILNYRIDNKSMTSINEVAKDFAASTSYYIEENLDSIIAELKTKTSEADAKRFITELSKKYGYNADDFFVALTHTSIDENPKDVLHYHRTGVDAALKIISSGSLKGRSTRIAEGEDVSNLTGGSSNRVQFTRDNNQGLGYSPDEYSLGAHDNDVVFVFDSNIFKEATYNPFGAYPTVEKLNLSNACVAILAKTKELGETLQRALQETALNVQVNLQSEFNDTLRKDILEHRKPQTPIQEVDYGTVDNPKSHEQKLAMAKSKNDALIQEKQKLIDKQQKISEEMKNHSNKGWDNQLKELELSEKMAYLEIKLNDLEFEIEKSEADLDLLSGTILMDDHKMLIEEIDKKKVEDRTKNETKYVQIGLTRAKLQEKIGIRDQDDYILEEAQDDKRKYEILLKKLNQNFDGDATADLYEASQWRVEDSGETYLDGSPIFITYRKGTVLLVDDVATSQSMDFVDQIAKSNETMKRYYIDKYASIVGSEYIDSKTTVFVTGKGKMNDFSKLIGRGSVEASTNAFNFDNDGRNFVIMSADGKSSTAKHEINHGLFSLQFKRSTTVNSIRGFIDENLETARNKPNLAEAAVSGFDEAGNDLLSKRITLGEGEDIMDSIYSPDNARSLYKDGVGLLAQIGDAAEAKGWSFYDDLERAGVEGRNNSLLPFGSEYNTTQMGNFLNTMKEMAGGDSEKAARVIANVGLYTKSGVLPQAKLDEIQDFIKRIVPKE